MFFLSTKELWQGVCRRLIQTRNGNVKRIYAETVGKDYWFGMEKGQDRRFGGDVTKRFYRPPREFNLC